MSDVKSPISLRALRQSLPPIRAAERTSVKALSVAAALASSVSASALAQSASTTLPPVKVDAPHEKPRTVAPAKPKPVVAQARPARHAAPSHQASGQRRGAPGASTAGGEGAGGGGVPAFVAAANANPYADPVAPYKVDRLSSNKFTQPVLNTPRTVTVLSKEVLDDKNAFSLRESAAAPPASRLASAKAATPSAIVSSFAASTRATIFSSTASAIRASTSARTSTPNRWKSCAGRIKLRRPRHGGRRDQHRHQTGGRSRLRRLQGDRGLLRPYEAADARR